MAMSKQMLEQDERMLKMSRISTPDCLDMEDDYANQDDDFGENESD